MQNDELPQYEEETQIFVLVSREGGYGCLVELSSGRQWVYAFTTQKKAEDFLRVMRSEGMMKNINRLLPCTLGEWFTWKEKQDLPDISIDSDPFDILDYPMHVPADSSKHDIECVTKELPHGKAYRVKVSPRKDLRDS